MVDHHLLSSPSQNPSHSVFVNNDQMSMEFPDDLSERNTKPNGLRIYQLNRALALLSQQNDPLTLYYAKMKKIWDELRALEGAPQCTCGVLSNCTCNLSKRLEELDSRRKLIQFLMGLNSRYDEGLRKQVLAMDPLPSAVSYTHLTLPTKRIV